MTSIESIIQQLKSERDRISQAITALESVAGSKSENTRTGGKRVVSAASRAKMRRAQEARWAKVKGQAKPTPKLTLVKRTMSASARRKIAAAQRARWAKVRAGKR